MLSKKKKCSVCLRMLPAKDFSSGTNKKGDFERKICRTCNQKRREVSKSKSPEDYIRNLYTQLKSSRRDSGYNWDIEVDYLLGIWDAQKGRCALSGMYMTWQKGQGNINYSISIDRKNNNLGYEVGNIQLVCSVVNKMKLTLSDSELYWWCKNIVNEREKNV